MGQISSFDLLILSFPNTACQIQVTHTLMCGSSLLFHSFLYLFLCQCNAGSVIHLEILNGHFSSIVLFVQSCFGVFLATCEL